MYSKINTAIMDGLTARIISIEVDISQGMPYIEMVGHLSPEVREAKERVKTALHNCGIVLPAKRITINMYPADIRKSGTSFDLPVAVALLAAMGAIPYASTDDILIIGELGLDGKILPVKGILSIVTATFKENIKKYILPTENYLEASLVKQSTYFAFSHLKDVIDYFRGKKYSAPVIDNREEKNLANTKDFSEVNGQLLGRRVCEISACGMHNLLLVGPPGAGKTMLAERMPSILPELTEEEKLEVTKIYSVCGLINNQNASLMERPFLSPHHSVTKIGLLGGGKNPKPGDISLAHNGVLFLDELTEFDKGILEALRIPLEDHQILITRAETSVLFPSNFLLVGAMNPCNCGYYPNMNKCHCTHAVLKRHIDKLSFPLMERIDLCVLTNAVEFNEISELKKNESSFEIKKRVVRCHEIQRERYINESFQYNSHIPSDKLEKYCLLDEATREYMRKTYDEKNLTGRTYHKILRVARTIADMDQEKDISLKHLKEAITFRCFDQHYFGGVL